MVLNKAGLGKCLESFPTPWKTPYVLTNRFSTILGIIGVDFKWIWTGPKSAAFDPKAWNIALGFEYGGFG